MPTNCSLPKEVCEGLRSSQLPLTLAINMMTAADRAYRAGWTHMASTKYCRAAHYFRASKLIYVHDQEMRAWVEAQLKLCNVKSQIAFTAGQGAKVVHLRDLASELLLGASAPLLLDGTDRLHRPFRPAATAPPPPKRPHPRPFRGACHARAAHRDEPHQTIVTRCLEPAFRRSKH